MIYKVYDFKSAIDALEDVYKKMDTDREAFDKEATKLEEEVKQLREEIKRLGLVDKRLRFDCKEVWEENKRLMEALKWTIERLIDSNNQDPTLEEIGCIMKGE